MKRYLAFFGDDHYPRGGMDDFIGDFDTEEEAQKAIVDALNEDKKGASKYYSTLPKWSTHWADVFDTVKREKVYTTKEE